MVIGKSEIQEHNVGIYGRINSQFFTNEFGGIMYLRRGPDGCLKPRGHSGSQYKLVSVEDTTIEEILEI